MVEEVGDGAHSGDPTRFDRGRHASAPTRGARKRCAAAMGQS
ncbi:hypothetical protein [Lysobacter gummosus]